MLGKPRILLLDEPTEGIQPNIVLDIENAINQIIKDTGIGVLLVEQHLHFVRQANRYYAMQRGGIVASGNTSELSQAVIDKFLSVYIDYYFKLIKNFIHFSHLIRSILFGCSLINLLNSIASVLAS